MYECKNVRMNEWMNELINEWINKAKQKNIQHLKFPQNVENLIAWRVLPFWLWNVYFVSWIRQIILLYSTIIYCTVMYSTVRYYTVLFSTVMYCTALRWTLYTGTFVWGIHRHIRVGYSTESSSIANHHLLVIASVTYILKRIINHTETYQINFVSSNFKTDHSKSS